MLMNARARREAMSHLDRGDYVMAKHVVSSALSASMPLFRSAPASPEVMEERQQLEELESSLDNRERDRMTRKKLVYESYRRSNSKK
jgi:hypothetical protein